MESLRATSGVLLLHRASQRADNLFGQEVGASLTRSQFEVLLAAKNSPGGTQTAIMAATGMNRSSVALSVSGLIKKGWLQRRRNQRDRRSNSVRLTASGAAVLDSAELGARKADDALFAALSPTERSRFLGILTRIVDDQKT